MRLKRFELIPALQTRRCSINICLITLRQLHAVGHNVIIDVIQLGRKRQSVVLKPITNYERLATGSGAENDQRWLEGACTA